MYKLFLIPTLFFFFFNICFAQNNLTFNNLSLHDESKAPKYSVTINYPQIAGAQLSPAEKKFNAVMKERINTAVENFKQTVKENEKYPIPSEIRANGSTLTIDYQLSMINKSFVSVRYGMDTYFAGAAHPTRMYHSLNYDLTLNKEVSLANILQPNTNSLQKIADYSSKQLKAKLKNDMFAEGFNPIPKNYQVWNAMPKGLRITFNEYQVAAYVYGPQQVLIPYANLKNILSDKTALGKCIKNSTCQFKIIHSPKQPVKYQ